MKILEIIRLEESEQGTIGVLKIDKRVFCSTLEPADRLNERNVSSIPAQQYRVGPVQSPRFGKTYEVRDVPGRSNILFHAGNTAGDTAGCILLGQYPDKLRGDRAVRNSGATFKRFLIELEGSDGVHLTISEVY